MTKAFWVAAFISVLLFGAVLQLASIISLGVPPARPPLPLPGRQYVSATRDGQADHSLFYFDIFGFGERIRKAEVLVAGSSHAEFGIDSSAIIPGKRSFNMALGGGESLDFAVQVLNRHGPASTHLVIDPFAPDHGLSAEGRLVIGLSRAAGYHRVLSIWTGFLRNWIIQGLLPRLTFADWRIRFDQPIDVAVIRDWQTADVIAFYSSKGEVFADPSHGHPLDLRGPGWNVVAPSDADASALKAIGPAVVTTIPYPSYTEETGRLFANEIGAKFVSVDPNGLTYYDYHHLNAKGREMATKLLRRAQ